MFWRGGAGFTLLVLPISNLPLYWAFYRGYCHFAAWRGGGALREKLGAGAGADGVLFDGSRRLDALLGEDGAARGEVLEALAEEYDMPDLPAHFKQARHQLEALRKRGKQEAPEDA